MSVETVTLTLGILGAAFLLGQTLLFGFTWYENAVHSRRFQESIREAVLATHLENNRLIRENGRLIKENDRFIRAMHADTTRFLKDLDTRTTRILHRVEEPPKEPPP